MTRNIWMISMVIAVVGMLALPPVSAADDGSDACANGSDAGNSWTTATQLPSTTECEGNLDASRDKDDWYKITSRTMPHYTSVEVCNNGEQGVRFELHHRASVSAHNLVSYLVAPLSPTLKASKAIPAGDCETLEDTETTPGQYYIHGKTVGGSGEIPYSLEIKSGTFPLVAVRH